MGTRLQGRVTVRTGAASGIGEATARRFIDEGCRLVVGDIQKEQGAPRIADDRPRGCEAGKSGR